MSAAVLGKENRGLMRERLRFLVFKIGEGKASVRRVSSRQDPATRKNRALMRAETNDIVLLWRIFKCIARLVEANLSTRRTVVAFIVMRDF